MNKLRQVLRCHGSGTGAKSISNLTGVARNTVRKYLRRLVELGTGVEELLKLDDSELNARFGIKTAASENTSERYVELMSLMPGYVKRLKKKGMTRRTQNAVAAMAVRVRIPPPPHRDVFCRNS